MRLHVRTAALFAAALVAVTPLPAASTTAASSLPAKCSKADQGEFRKRDSKHADICLDRRWVTIEGSRRTLAKCGSSNFAGRGGYVSDASGTINYCLPLKLVRLYDYFGCDAGKRGQIWGENRDRSTYYAFVRCDTGKQIRRVQTKSRCSFDAQDYTERRRKDGEKQRRRVDCERPEQPVFGRWRNV